MISSYQQGEFSAYCSTILSNWITIGLIKVKIKSIIGDVIATGKIRSVHVGLQSC